MSDGKHVHERASLQIDTDGEVDDADTPEEVLEAINKAIDEGNVEVEFEVEDVEDDSEE